MKLNFAVLAVTLACAKVAWAEFPLTVLHTNDFHARFEPISKIDGPCRPEDNAGGDCFGGIARLATAVAAARDRAENTVLLDGGDQFQGTLFYNYYKGMAAAEMMNRLGYDAMVVGNHEFDDGPEVLSAFVESVDFPVLMANADISNEPALAGIVERSHVLEIGGEKIGLIGVTPANNGDLASPGPNIVFHDPVRVVQAEVDRLTEDGVNKIILLSHSGLEVDRQIARETAGVDIIVGGHSHTLLSNTLPEAAGPYPEMVGDTAIVQASAFGKFLGELQVVFDNDGQIIEVMGEPLIMNAAVAEDLATVDRVMELAEPLEAIRNRVVAYSDAAIEGEREACRVGECAMGNLVADAMLDRVKNQGVQIAIQNGGGLRASIDPGPVTLGEVLTVLPYQNTLATFDVTGAAILAALENGLCQIEEGAGRFPQVSGLRFTFDPAAEKFSRVREVLVADGDAYVPLDPDATYRVVSNNFVRNGGDGYEMFVDARNVYDFGPDIADVTMQYLAERGSYTPYTDGRIAALGQATQPGNAGRLGAAKSLSSATMKETKTQ